MDFNIFMSSILIFLIGWIVFYLRIYVLTLKTFFTSFKEKYADLTSP